MLAEAIEEAQRARGISDKELAERAGISRTTLYGIKNGTVAKPRRTTLEAISRALVLEPEDAEELGRRERAAWEAVVRAVEIGNDRVERGLETHGMALHNVVLALTVLGPYELVGQTDYAYGLRVSEKPGREPGE